LALARPARALDSETFDDFRRVGKSPDARKQPDPLLLDDHAFEPTLRWKLLDVLTPHFYGGDVGGFSDNYLLEPSSVHPSQTPYWRTSLGGRGDVQLEDHVFSLGYLAAESLYFRGVEGSRDTLDQRADARADLNWNEVAAHADATWGRLAFPQEIQVQGLAREEYGNAQAWVEGQLGRFGAKVGGSFRRDYFLHGLDSVLGTLDHDTWGASVQANADVWEKLSLVLEYNFEAVRFDKPVNRDYDAHQVRAGLSGELTPKITLSLKVGADYQLPDQGTGSFQDKQSYKGFACAAAVAWQALDELALAASYRRDLTWAVGTNFETVDALDLSVTWKFGPGEKLRLRGGFVYEHAQPDQGGHQDRIRAHAVFGWQIQPWLDATASYGYVQSLGSGAFQATAYDEHRAEVSLAFGL
jgi:hypothetical protein